MIRAYLTDPSPLATSEYMQITGATMGRRLLAIAAVPLALGGCITVEAPTEPIVIELNVNIRQEVSYRLAEDAGDTIENNADIF